MSDVRVNSDDRDAPSSQRATATVELGSVPPGGGAATPGGIVAGRYELRGVLGRGGFGVVYRAVDRRSGAPVALKMLRSTRLCESGIRRFTREAELMGELDHPGLVPILDSGREGDSLFLTMEIVAGETLADRLGNGPLPVDEVIRIARAVLEALSILHRAGIVHRDVKPSNILIGDDGRIRLADLGLALRLHADETRATAPETVMGTLEYLSPEQALGEQVDARSDLYSLGVTLFEALTGELPYRRRSSLGTLLARLEGLPPDARERRGEVPTWLAGIVRELLLRDADERYPSTEAVLRDLVRRRCGRTRRRGKSRRVRRRPWRLMATGTVLLFAICALGWAALHREPTLVDVARQEDGLAGVGESGAILWQRSGVAGNLHRGRLRPGEGEVLVGILPDPGRRRDLAACRVLSIVDPGTGRTLRTVELPTAAAQFPDFSRTYSPRVTLVDLDGDGFDEVVVRYVHTPYWPAFIVVHEPLLARSRVAIVSSGHLHFQRALDVNGDGAKELLLTGSNNRMGMSAVAAAVELVPPVNRPAEDGRRLMARTPDMAPTLDVGDPLAWYKLLPRRFRPGDSAVEVDRERRTLSLVATGGPPYVLRFDGFEHLRDHGVAGPARRRARQEAYRSLLEAQRIAGAQYTEEALAETESARDAADRAGDPELAEYARRIEGKILIAAGRYAAADRLFREILATTGARSEVAFDAARSFHRTGALERAVDWYWRGLGPQSEQEYGRAYYEFVGGILFALEELGRLDEAAAALDLLEGAILVARNKASIDHFLVFRSYLSWRRGRGVSPETLPGDVLGSNTEDIFSYLVLELRFAAGENPRQLLPEVTRELAASSETVPMLRSLKAVLLHEMDLHSEAEEAARRALREVEGPRDDEIYSRVFRSLVERRGEALAGGADAPGDGRTLALPRAGGESRVGNRSGDGDGPRPSDRPTVERSGARGAP